MIRVRNSQIFFRTPAPTAADIVAAIAGQNIAPGSVNGEGGPFIPWLFHGDAAGAGIPGYGSPQTSGYSGAPRLVYDSDTGNLYWFDGGSIHQLAYV